MYHEIDNLRPDEVEYLVRKYDDEQIQLLKLDKLDFDEKDDFEDSDASKRSYTSEQP